MALDAINIRSRSRSRSPGLDHEEGIRDNGWQRLRDASSSTRRLHTQAALRRPGLGSSFDRDRYETSDSSWRSMRTGESSAASALRMQQRFVRATHLSNPALPIAHQTAIPLMGSDQPNADTTAALLAVRLPSSKNDAPTLAQLYSQLTESIPSAGPQYDENQARSITSFSAPYSDMDRPHLHAHRHRHHPVARQRSEWFISRAVTKMQRAQHISSSENSLNSGRGLNEQSQNDPVGSSGRQRCPRCGDSLPLNATAEELARHRQSISHRLGLNEPVSSASASEAPSPVPSEAPTPAIRSRSSSPVAVSALDTSMKALNRRSEKPARRLSNAPRWKKIAHDNVGHSLLSRMGWKEGMGLGAQEWKWQQLKREKVKRQRSNAVRALLLRQAASSQDTSTQAAATLQSAESSTDGLPVHETVEPPSESDWLQWLVQENSNAALQDSSGMQTFFPFQYDAQDPAAQLNAARLWLSGLAGSDLEWFQCLTQDEQTHLEHALMSGSVTLEDIQNALWTSMQQSGAAPVPDLQSSQTTEIMDEASPSNALLYPVQVELRSNRGGIGSRRPASNQQKRRSRDAEGSVEIRKQLHPSDETLDKKPRQSSFAHRPLKPGSRQRSTSKSKGSAEHASKHADLTRRQRELACQKDKQDWLDLRASLS